MTQAEWRIRIGQARDRELLAAFSCADPAHAWTAEAEQLIAPATC